MRNYPWYTGWHKDFADKNLLVIGIHTPESAGEKQIDRIRQKAKENRLEFPIAVDNSLKMWKAWGNRYWPSTYLIDKQGFVRYRWDGELNGKEIQGEKIMRKHIEELLAE